MALTPELEEDGFPTGSLQSKQMLHKNGGRHPLGVVFVFNPDGHLLRIRTADSKAQEGRQGTAFLPGTYLPAIGEHPIASYHTPLQYFVPITETRSASRVPGDPKLSRVDGEEGYFMEGPKEAGARGVRSELLDGSKVSLDDVLASTVDLHRYAKVDLSSVSGFPNNEFHWFIAFYYDPQKHGDFKLNSNELSEAYFEPVNHHGIGHMLKGFPEGYAREVMRAVAAGYDLHEKTDKISAFVQRYKVRRVNTPLMDRVHGKPLAKIDFGEDKDVYRALITKTA